LSFNYIQEFIHICRTVLQENAWRTLKQRSEVVHMNERAFGTKEVSEMLNVGDSTLRKWCIALEKEGYTFTKGVRNSRAFIKKDIIVLEDIKLLLQESGMNLESTVKVTLSKHHSENMNDNDSNNGERTPLILQENGSKISNNTSIEYLKIQEQLLERVERIERSHEERLKNIEEKLDYRNKLLLETLQEIQETKKIIAVTKEKKWWEFWK
jgi:DNA-binding transcriptional MerR regulator